MESSYPSTGFLGWVGIHTLVFQYVASYMTKTMFSTLELSGAVSLLFYIYDIAMAYCLEQE